MRVLVRTSALATVLIFSQSLFLVLTTGSCVEVVVSNFSGALAQRPELAEPCPGPKRLQGQEPAFDDIPIASRSFAEEHGSDGYICQEIQFTIAFTLWSQVLSSPHGSLHRAAP